MVLKEDEAVYLTKNGYGSMVVMSIEKYAEMMEEIQINRALEERFGDIDIDKMLLDTEKELDNTDTKYMTHEEVFSKARRIIDGEK